MIQILIQDINNWASGILVGIEPTIIIRGKIKESILRIATIRVPLGQIADCEIKDKHGTWIYGKLIDAYEE